jgi:serine/threonine protein kinase
MKSISFSKVAQKEKDAALNEIRLLASISIPNVIQYEGSFYNEDYQTLCIIMELADGGDL